jgi:hypothetical protein
MYYNQYDDKFYYNYYKNKYNAVHTQVKKINPNFLLKK